MSRTSVVLLSGGLDSCVVAAQALAEGDVLHGVVVDYGQSHHTEVLAAVRIAQHMGFECRVVSISRTAFGGVGVAGAYSEGAGYVPARNTVLIALAVSVAEQVGASRVLIGCNADDFADYPDCRPAYLDSWAHVAPDVHVEAPLVHLTKANVIRLGRALSAPLDMTVSCYRGADCGVCNACVLRQRAFAEGEVDV